ncbi:BTB_2 domain-containing protein [Durusdinium trenchii]|uniref:BTB_2 domain-containing protein n=1 Tax=Durusdinium trenchii TaxID=1381693 RepID=A0ABP0K534_9DINO
MLWMAYGFLEGENLFETAGLTVDLRSYRDASPSLWAELKRCFRKDEGDEMQHHLLELPKDAELGGEMMPLARLLTGGSEPCANTTETGAKTPTREDLALELKARRLVISWLRQALEESRAAEEKLKVERGEEEPWRSARRLLQLERPVLQLELDVSERFCSEGSEALEGDFEAFAQRTWQRDSGWMGSSSRRVAAAHRAPRRNRRAWRFGAVGPGAAMVKAMDAENGRVHVAEGQSNKEWLPQSGYGGTGGLKAHLAQRVPVLRDAAAFREVRRILREDYGGPRALLAELRTQGFVENSRLATGEGAPFNLFARLADGQMQQPGMEEEQAALKDYGQIFCICKNRPENDEKWQSEDAEWLGKASMAARHRFLTTKDLRWNFFNALTMGMTDDDDVVGGLSESIQLLGQLKAAAMTYASKMGTWSEKLGLFFHVYGHNSVNSLHLHLVDMNFLGPTFKKLDYKNCPLSAVLEVLQDELAMATRPPRAPEDVIDLNVAGELLSVSAATFAAAKGLRAPGRLRDAQGRLFLDLPVVLVREILDALRLHGLRGHVGPLKLRLVDEDRQAVADVLGLTLESPET